MPLKNSRLREFSSRRIYQVLQRVMILLLPVVEVIDLPVLHALFQLARALEPGEGQLLAMALSRAAGSH